MSSGLNRRKVGCSLYVAASSDAGHDDIDTALYNYIQMKRHHSKHEDWMRQALRAAFVADMNSLQAFKTVREVKGLIDESHSGTFNEKE